MYRVMGSYGAYREVWAVKKTLRGAGQFYEGLPRRDREGLKECRAFVVDEDHNDVTGDAQWAVVD